MAARGDTNFLFECWKVFHKWTQRTSEPVFNTRREIAYLQVVMQCSVYYLNTNEIANNNISLWSPWQENWVTIASNFYFRPQVPKKLP